MYFTPKELAVLFNRAERTIRDWIQKAKPKKQGKNKYYAPDLFKWYEETFTKVAQDEKALSRALKAVELEKKQIELEVLKGKLIEREKVEIEWAQRTAEFRQGLIALEFKLAKKLAGRKLTLPQARKVLREEIFGILRAYAREGEYTPQALDIPLEKFEQAYVQFLDQLKKTDCAKPKVTVECNGKSNRKRKKSA